MRCKYFIGTILFILAFGVCANDLDELPASTFFAYPKITQVKISPDGKYLAAVVSDSKTGEENKMLAVLTADSKHKVTASFSMIGNQLIRSIWWANNRRILVASATQTGSFDPPVGDGGLYAIDVDGKNKMQLMPEANGGSAHNPLLAGAAFHGQGVWFDYLLDRNLKDKKHVIVYGYTYEGGSYQHIEQAYRLNIYTGALHQLVVSPAANGGFVADNSGEIRIATGWNTANGEPKLFYRKNSSQLHWKDLSALYKDSDPAFPEIGPIGFMPGDQNIYWFGRTPTSTLGLYALNPADMSLQPIFTDPDYDIDDYYTSFEWKRPVKIVAIETMPGYPQIHILDPNDQKANYLAMLFKAFNGQEVDITSNTSDDNLMVVRVDSDTNPGTFYLFNAKTGKVTFMFRAKPEINPAKMASMLPIQFKARDGLLIHGYLTLPLGSKGKNLPLILVVHGGPHGIRDEWGWDPEVQFFANHGYAVLQVNYRGSGGYGMKFQDLGYRHWGSTMQDDLADGVHWAIKKGYADPARVCIYGGSYGGYAALESVIRYPDLYKCAVGYAGVYDLTLFNHHGDTHHYASGLRYLDVVLGNNDAQLKKYSPAYNAKKIKVPLFIIYSGQDHRVVPENAKELIAALDKLHKHYETMYEPNEMHGYYKPEHRNILYTRMMAFFNKYIGPGAAKH